MGTPTYVIRARLQIAMGNALARRLRGYASPIDCDAAAHFLIPDGGAARQGDDPRYLLRSVGLAHIVPRMLEIESDAIRRWSGDEARSVVRGLVQNGHRTADVVRILAIYMKAHPEIFGAVSALAGMIY